MGDTTGGSRYPRSQLERRIVTNMLGMAAFEVGDPVLLFILVEADDTLIHGLCLWKWRAVVRARSIYQ
jgi:hypothetical protein